MLLTANEARAAEEENKACLFTIDESSIGDKRRDYLTHLSEGNRRKRIVSIRTRDVVDADSGRVVG
jgi:hypothetical protein